MDTIDGMDSSTPDIQKLLKEGFDTKNIKKFIKAIRLGAQLDVPFEDDESLKTVYELVLSKYGYFKFVKACINAGCDVNYKDSFGKAAINYVADSRDPRNFKELLDHGNQKIDIDYVYTRETVLNRLVKTFVEEESDQVAKCIRMLLYYGASPNQRNWEGLTPLEYLLNNQRVPTPICCDLVIAFIKKQDLEFPLYRKGLDYLLKNSKDFFTRFKATSNHPYDLLVRSFMDMKKDTLLFTLKHYEKNYEGWNRIKMQQRLLYAYIKDPKNSQSALDAVVTMTAPNTPEENENLVLMAIKEGSWNTVLALLKVDRIRSLSRRKLLRSTIGQVRTQELLNRKEYQDCLIALLEHQDNLLIMMDEDDDGESKQNTPLHYAVQCRNEIAIRVLLRQGAPLGKFNARGQLPFEDIEESVLREHFDHCITNRGHKPSHINYEIILNLMNLTTEKNGLDMKPIDFIANTPNLSPLLLHPLITCFLQFNWNRLTRILFTHFFVFVLFAIALITHILLRLPTRIQNDYVIMGVMFLCFLYILYMLIVIVLEYWFLDDLPHWLDFTLIGLVIVTCLEFGNEETQRVIAIAAILIMALKLSTLIGSLPLMTVSTHMLILRQVTITFLKSLGHYFIFPLTFALGFYLIFAQSDDNTKSDEFLTFSDKSGSFLKMLTMFHNVYENNDFTGYWSTLIIILFMFMTMILTNLLSALAVSDTQEIRAQVELNAAIHRVKLLMKYEVFLKNDMNHWLNAFIQFFLLVRRDKTSYGYLSIQPNKSNNVHVYEKRHRNDSLESAYDSEDEESWGYIEPDNEDGGSESDTSYNPSEKFILITDDMLEKNEDVKTSIDVTIDKLTVCRALRILRMKSNRDAEEKREELTEKRLEDIYNMLQNMQKEKK